MEGKFCNSCKKKIVNDPTAARFKCPNCGDFEITRCGSCRVNATKYKCAACEFTGPN